MNEAVRQKLTALYGGKIPRGVWAFFELGGLDCESLVNRCRSAEVAYKQELETLRHVEERARAAAELLDLYFCVVARRRPEGELAGAFGVDDPLDLLPVQVRARTLEREGGKGRRIAC